MMRLLITGASGFVGQHLIRFLHAAGCTELHGCSRNSPSSNKAITFHQVNWGSIDSIASILKSIQPTAMIHLAGHADAGGSFANPLAAWTGNLTPTINLYEAIRLSGQQPRVLHVSSGAVYGRSMSSVTPVDELAEMIPMSPYAASKAAGEMAAIQYGQHFPIIRVRPFNHIGAGQSNHFALANFAEQVARIELRQCAPVLETGNLDVERDIIDVRDMARAYALLLEKGEPGQVYNAGRGQPVTMRHCVEQLLKLANVPITLQSRNDRKRSIDVQRMRISIQKLKETTGWSPSIPLNETIESVLNDWRSRVTTLAS